MSRPLDFRLLGPLEVRDGERSLALGGRKQRTLLAILLLHANEVVASDTLIDGLWGERAPKTAGTALQVYVSNLRKLLSPERLETRTPGYLLHVEPEELDLARFERLTSEGNGDDPQAAASALAEALALWRGRPLADFAYDSFAQGEIARLEELRLSVVEQRIDAELQLGKHAELVGELEALVAEYPLRERLRRQLMLALYRSDRQTEALEAYHDARQTLVEELGIEPSVPLRELEQAILRQDSGLAVPAAAERASTNLPAPPSPLIGREREPGELVELVSQARLVTLTGAGGSGKTRLALELAAELLDEFPDGVTWVPLQALRDPGLVVPAIAAAVGAENGLAAHIGSKRMLLLLDNFEQLLPAAPELADLLTQTPEMKLLATSREPLHLAGEYEYPVPPLRELDAFALFAERARAVRPDFELDETVAEICRRVDCLPLAIELAAARVKALPSGNLLQLLERRLPLLTGGRRDAPARQQTLRATIAWSYELLTPAEQRLFARLAVFVGGCTLDAAEQVCDADLDSLATLVDKSLLRQDAGRYSMLETIREYALERLQDRGEQAELGARHAAHFLALAERIEQRLGSDQEHVHRFEARRLREASWAEYDNSWAALAWAIEQGDREFALRLVATSDAFRWGHTLAEARKAFELALAVEGVSSPAVEAKALLEASWVAREGGDLETAVALSENALALSRSIGDRRMVAWALRWRALYLGGQGRRDEARRTLQRLIAHARRFELDDEHSGLREVLPQRGHGGGLDVRTMLSRADFSPSRG